MLGTAALQGTALMTQMLAVLVLQTGAIRFNPFTVLLTFFFDE